MIKQTLATMTLTIAGRGDNKPYGIINECKDRGNDCKAYFFPKDNKQYKAGEILHVKVIGVAVTETENIMIAVKSDRMVESLSELATNERIRLNQMFAVSSIQNASANEETIVYGDVFHDMEYARMLMWGNSES